MLILGLGRAIQMLAMFASYRLLSTFFSAENLSSYYFLLSVAGLFGLLVANPIGMYLNRIIHTSKTDGTLNSTTTYFLKIFTATSLIVIPIVLIFKSKIDEPYLETLFVALILLLYVIGAAISGFLISLLNILAKNTAFVLLISLSAIVGLTLSVGIVQYVERSPTLWLLGQAIATTLFGLIAVLVLRKLFPLDRSKFQLNTKEILRFSTPILITNIFVWVMSQSFRFFLKGNVDDALLGEMAFGLGLASSLVVAVEYLFHQLLLPSFYSELDKDSYAREVSWNKLFLKSIPAFICLIIYMIMLSPFLFNVLAHDKLKNASMYFAIGTVVELFRILGNTMNLGFHSEKKTKQSMKSYIFGGLVTLIGILVISMNSEYLKLTPYILILGQFIIFISLYFRLKAIMTIRSPIKLILKYMGYSLVFLLALVIDHDQNLVFSLGVCAIFGLYLLFLFHKIQRVEIE